MTFAQWESSLWKPMPFHKRAARWMKERADDFFQGASWGFGMLFGVVWFLYLIKVFQ